MGHEYGVCGLTLGAPTLKGHLHALDGDIPHAKSSATATAMKSAATAIAAASNALEVRLLLDVFIDCYPPLVPCVPIWANDLEGRL